MKGRQRSQILKLVAAGTLAVVLAGCGQEPVMSPTTDTFSGQPIPLPADERPTLLPTLQGADYGSATVTISAAEGGVVTFGRYRLDFPAGALNSDTAITIRQTDPAVMRVELLPHGIRFNRPVTFSARVGDILPSGARQLGVAWFNDSTGQWEVVSQQGVGAATASAGLWHFSDYESFTSG